MDTTINTLCATLVELQNQTVGIMKNPYTGTLEPIVEDNEHTFKTITVGNLLGSSDNNYPKSDSKWSNRKYFSEDKTKSMYDMEPLELYEFTKSFDNK